ncbi:MAG: enoyl-CoA hydratase-related protein [Actinomycetota bacterium]|nr:enoyl-CoA hydratase-related protein [Actinomycetota bacterium]
MITYNVKGGVGTITIDDPEKRNPLSNIEMAVLAQAIKRSAVDESVAVVVVTGAGDKAFSAGGDLKGGFVDDPLPGHEARGALADLLRAMRRNPKPIVGRINGVALGGGFGVVAACDIAVASDSARFGTPEIDLGLWPMMISAVLIPIVPRKALIEMMMTGRVIDAHEALRLGVVSRVVPAEDLDSEVAATVDILLSKSPAALALGKESFYAIENMDVDTALDHLQIGLTALSMTEDAAEGVDAFLNKRDAIWKGR